jgi:FlaA1/EpsC-like NDP-sugar epimerase
MRRHDFFFGLVRIPLELLLVLLAFWIARSVRIFTDLIPGVELAPHFLETPYLIFVALVSYGILATIFSFQQLYSIDRVTGMIEEIFTLIKSVFVGFFVMIGLIYLSNGFPYETILIPRLILIFAFVLSLVFIIIERFYVRHIRLLGIRRKWLSNKRVLLVMNHRESDLEKLLKSDQYTHVLGYISPIDQGSSFKYLGTIGEHAQIIEKYDVEDIIVLSHDLPYEIKKNLFEYCQIYGIRYRYIGNLYETTKHNAYIDFVGRIPFIEIRTIGLTPW